MELDSKKLMRKAVWLAFVPFLAANERCQLTGAEPAEPSGDPCPSGAADRGFDLDRDLASCVVGDPEGNDPGARYGRLYNVYCPGRMDPYDAIDVAQELAAGNGP